MVKESALMADGSLRHMSPMNSPVHLSLVAEVQSILYRREILTIANALRLVFAVVNILFAPMIFKNSGGFAFIWQGDLPVRTQILVIGAGYIIGIAIFTLINLKKRGDEKLFLFNALFDAFAMMLFIMALDVVHNWNFLSLCFLSSILLSLLTLNLLQCGIYTFFLYFEMMVVFSIWKVFEDFNWAMMTPMRIVNHADIISKQILSASMGLGNTAVMICAFALLIFMMGYLANNARENKILAKINQSSLNQSRQLNESIIADMPSGLIVVNGKGELIAMNRRARALFHIRGNDDIPHRLFNLSPMLARQLASWEDLQHQDLQTLEIYGDAYSTTFTPLEIEHYAPLVMLSLENVEVSYQRVRETRLASLGRLTAGIAHEIRNPLGSVQSANELIMEMAEDRPKIQYLCQKVRNNTKRMNAIISDILEMFRGGEGNHQMLVLNDFVQTTVESSRADNDLERISISLDLAATQRLVVNFDPGHLSQILHNLMLNSVKHSGREDVSIRIVSRISGGGRSLYLDVMDNGQGIPKEDQEHIFEPFFSKRQGIGLGLYLVREMCLANQAHITYLPNANGACFRIIMTRYLPENIHKGQ